MKVSVTYLINSGFLLRIDDTLLLFDDYRDPSAAVDQAIREGMKDFYIFASHAHFDHFDKHILDYAKEATAYIGKGHMVVTKGFVYGAKHLTNLHLEVHIVLYDM